MCNKTPWLNIFTWACVSSRAHISKVYISSALTVMKLYGASLTLKIFKFYAFFTLTANPLTPSDALLVIIMRERFFRGGVGARSSWSQKLNPAIFISFTNIFDAPVFDFQIFECKKTWIATKHVLVWQKTTARFSVTFFLHNFERIAGTTVSVYYTGMRASLIVQPAIVGVEDFDCFAVFAADDTCFSLTNDNRPWILCRKLKMKKKMS